MATRSRVQIHARGEVAQLRRDFGDIPPALRKTLRPKLRKAAQPIVADAKSNASWSTRIPGAIKIRTSFTGKGAGLFIRVDSKKAPHARPLENMGEHGTFRHPVFGNRDVWVSQRARPFLFPAVEKGRRDVVEATVEAIETAARMHGWR